MTFTKEQLIARAETVLSNARTAADFHESKPYHLMDVHLAELALAALAGMGAVPVACIDQANLDYLKSGSDADVWPVSSSDTDSVLLYTTPQSLTTSERAELENYRNAQQVVPDENGLLPCPFCGSPAEHYPDGDMEGYSVMCGHKNGDCDSWVFGFSTPEEAEKSWNTRATRHQGGK